MIDAKAQITSDNAQIAQKVHRPIFANGRAEGKSGLLSDEENKREEEKRFFSQTRFERFRRFARFSRFSRFRTIKALFRIFYVDEERKRFKGKNK